MSENLLDPNDLIVKPKKARGRPKVSEEHKLSIIKKNQDRNKENGYHKDYYKNHSSAVRCPICTKMTSENRLKQHQVSQKCSRIHLENSLIQLLKKHLVSEN